MRGAVLAGLLAIGACSPAAEDAVPAAEDAPAAQPSPAHSEATATAAAAAVTLALTADGLVRLSGSGQPSRSLAYGTPRAMIEAAVKQMAGAVTGRHRNEECGAGAMDFTEFGALTLNFQDDRLVGWFAKDGTRVPTTDGVLPGITRRELERERSVSMIAESTLDGEFEYALPDGSTIGGFMDGSTPDARVTALYAGTNCFFR